MHISVNDALLTSFIAGSISTAAVVYNIKRVKPLIVKVPSGVRHKANAPPVVENPCSTCLGTTKIVCPRCNGKGRMNHLDKWILPKGEFPIWCSWCSGSGEGYCDHCLGTGVHRERMGFQLPHKAKAAQSYSSLCTVLTVLSEHPVDEKSLEDVTKAFTVCISHAEKLCGMGPEALQCLGLSAIATSMQNCPRKLFLSKFVDAWNRVNTFARGKSPETAAAATETAVQMLKRLHTFMAAQGVKTIATQPVAQSMLTALQLLRSGPALLPCGLSLMEAVLQCMPQAARAQFQAASAACHSIMADVQIPIDLRSRAARVLSALPASQSKPDAQKQHLQGVLLALHAALSTIPAPVTDSQASQAAREALGDQFQGTWGECKLVPPAPASHHVPPQQRLDSITILTDCLIATLSRRNIPPVAVPISPTILLVSRLVAHRPLHVPYSEEQFTAPERAQLLLSGKYLLKAGLQFLRLLMQDREQLQPMAAALSRLLSELLLDASTPNRLPEDVRADVYSTVAAALQAFPLQETRPVQETLVPCAWAEFATPDGPNGGSAAHTAGPLKLAADPKSGNNSKGGGSKRSRRKRKAGEDGDLMGAFGDTLDRVSSSVEHAHRPSNICNVTSAQVHVLECIEVMHDITSGSLPPQLQVDLDVFTVSVLESCSWARHLTLTDARIHEVQGVAKVKQAATAAAAAMCRSGMRRNGQVPMAERIAKLLEQQPRDPAAEAVENIALRALQTSAALLVARKAAKAASHTPPSDHNAAANLSENKSTQNGVRMPAAQNSAKAQPLEPEFENILSLRVAAVMHRGLQLACGLGAVGIADDERVQDPAQRCPANDQSVDTHRPHHTGVDPHAVALSNAAPEHLQGLRAQTSAHHIFGGTGTQEQLTAMHTNGIASVAGPSSGAASAAVHAAHAQAVCEPMPQPLAATGPSAAQHIGTCGLSQMIVQETPVGSQMHGGFRDDHTAPVQRSDAQGQKCASTVAATVQNSTVLRSGSVPAAAGEHQGASPMHVGGGIAQGLAATTALPVNARGVEQPGGGMIAEQERADAVDNDDSDALPEIDSGPSEDDDEDSEPMA